MGKKIISSLILGAAIALTSQGAFAQAAKGAMTDGDIPINFMKKMKSMDTDKDGMVSKAEFLKYAEQMFDKMDKDKKGMMTSVQFMDFAKAMSSDIVGKKHE